MDDSIRPTSSLDRQSQEFSDERATMAGERELTMDIYSGSLLRLTPRDDTPTSATVSSVAAGVDGRGIEPDSTTTVNGAVLTGSGRRKNGFLPSGMSRGNDRGDRNGKKQQLGRKLAPAWRRFTAKQGQEVVDDHLATHSSPQTIASGINTSLDSQFATVTDSNRTARAGDIQDRAGLSGQNAVDAGEMRADVQRSSSVETRSSSAYEQQHLQVILGAPAGFRDNSFDENDEASRIAADGKLLSPRISMNTDGSSSPASQDFLSNITEAKKRPAPSVPQVKPSLPPPPMIVRDFNARKRPAPEAPSPSRDEQTTAPTSSEIIQSSVTERQTEVGDKPPANVVVPGVFRRSEGQSNSRSSGRSLGGSVSSILRRSSFIRHLESVVRRNTPTSSAVSTMTRGAEHSGAENSMHNQLSTPGDLNQSTSSIVSRLFHSALHNHDDGSKKKYKFPVPDIDVPAESTEQQPPDVGADGTERSSRVRRGFSYLKGADEAAEVTRRAADVTARRSHKSAEKAKTTRDVVETYDGTDDEEEMLRAARARLQAPQRRFDPSAATAPPSGGGGGRKQMLLDIVAAARRRARKTGMDADDDSDLQEDVAEVATDQYYPAQQTYNVRDASDERLPQPNSSSTYQSRDARESEDAISLGNRPEVPGGVSQTTSDGFDNGQPAGRQEFRASDYHYEPAVAKFSSVGAEGRAEGVTSYRAARHAHRGDIDRTPNAAEDGLAVDDAVYTASVRYSGYLPYTSVAPAANRHADAGFQSHRVPSLDDLQPRYHGRYPSVRRSYSSSSSSSSDEELDSLWVDDDEEGDGGYTVSIAGGQVRARRWDDRLRPQRPSASNHRRGSSLKRRPRVGERPVSVEIWSSGDEGESRWEDDRQRRRRFTAQRRPLPLTVDTDSFTSRPHSVIGHIRNPGITQLTELARRRVTGAESNHETLHYFSDPETKLGPYRSGAYVSQADVYLNSSASLDFIGPEVDTIASDRQKVPVVPLHAISLPVFQRRLEPIAAVDPHLADVGTKNRRYFVEMRLNAARGGREVIGVRNGADSSSNSGGSNGGGPAIRSLYGSAPQLLQVTDDVIDQYTGARYSATGGTGFSTMQPNVRHATVYDVTASTDQGASLLARRPQSTLSWTGGGAATSGHVVRSVTSARSPAAAAVRVAPAERRRPVSSVSGDVRRSTVEFDIELEPTQHLEMDEGRRSALLSSVHANGLAGQRSASPPRYTIQLNDTMRFDIDGNGDRWQRRQPAPNPPTYEHVRQRRQQRRHRPLEQNGDFVTERQQTVVNQRPPARPSRRRRQIPVEDSRMSKFNHINLDEEDEIIDDEDFGVVNHTETRRSATTTRADQQTSVNDLPRVVRGSILIRNSIDTAGTPRHVDVVTGDGDADTEAAFVVEDNTNMFDGLYRQSRENPIYLSDPEQSPDEVDGAAVNSRVHMSSRSRQNRRQDGRRRNATSIVDGLDAFDKTVKISRGMYTDRYVKIYINSLFYLV